MTVRKVNKRKHTIQINNKHIVHTKHQKVKKKEQTNRKTIKITEVQFREL